MRRPSVGLANLPPTCRWTDSGPPWGVVSTSQIVSDLGVDRGFWHTWKSRGLLPPSLPHEWFKRVAGAPLYYRRDVVEGWLAARHGLPFNYVEAWARSLRTDLGTETRSEAETRRWVRIYADAAGPRLLGGVEFTRQGFAAYLASLMVG